MGLSTSPLHDHTQALGAKLADFAGWAMPIEYAGTVAEHTAVREAVGMFDVSHLGKASVRGPGAAEFVNSCLTNDLGRIEPGRAQYTLCCDDPTGGVVDDMIAYLFGADHVFLVPNAANTAEVVRRLRAAAPAGIEVEDLHRAYGVIAVQGPRSEELVSRLGVPTDGEYMSFCEGMIHGRRVIVCRSGYTGEHGYEILPAWEDTTAVWDALLYTGNDLGLVLCGLGARDTLRTEMGYPLHGHELSMDITPVQARAGWAVGWRKPAFWGRDVLAAEREAGPARLLWGLELTDRGIPRPGMGVLVAGKPVGAVTSGTFSPTLKKGIALALVATDPGVEVGTEVAVDVRGRSVPARVVKPPMVEPHVR